MPRAKKDHLCLNIKIDAGLNRRLILNCMIRDPHTTAVQIGNEIGHSKATVQRAIDGLKAAGIVSRRGSNNGGQWVIVPPQQSAAATEES